MESKDLSQRVIVDALQKRTPIKPLHIHKVYQTHDWELGADGAVDVWAARNGFHNGPVCKRCYHSPCVHCNPNWNEGECVEDKHLCPSCNNVASRYNKYCPECGQALDWEEA